MGYLCETNRCTACGACIEICPRGCIKIVETQYGEKKVEVDEKNCIDCKLCRNACHILNNNITFLKAKKVYAAWSSDNATRIYAASGGVASELYKYALAHEVPVMATKFKRDEGVIFAEVKQDKDLSWARDSKYVFSCLKNAFSYYESQINLEHECIFIGLPCQVSAIKTYLKAKRLNVDNCLFVDIICHGVPPYSYLDEHIRNIEQRTKKLIKKVTFRYKSNYLLQLFTEEDSCVYSKKMDEDLYFRAFIESLNYRDNCYKCRYSREDRVSDITIGDYSGLGKIAEWKDRKEMVSLILCNTIKGESLIHKLKEEKYLTAIERPLDEPYHDMVGNPQLHHPSIPHPGRQKFLAAYLQSKDFDKSVFPILQKEFILYYIIMPFKKVYRFAIGFLSKEQKNKIKKMLKINK